MHTDSLETPRLVLRRFRRSDCDALQCIFGDAEVMQYGEGKQDNAWIAGWIEAQRAEYDNSSRLGALAVIEKSTGDFLGYAGLFVYPDIGGQAEVEIGYRFAKSQWGRGFATEAAIVVRDHALGVLRLPRLIAL
ncbi:MAG: RimJ/RimL family protein N-acetyltransferase, partial [Planctomycetota bacterium]